MTVIVLDTETTGFNGVKKASVVELGAVAITSEGKELGYFSSLIRPSHALGEWSAGALAINKLEPAALVVAPVADPIWSAFIEWVALYAPIPQVLSYNVSFDQGAMAKTFPASVHLPWGPCIMRAASEKLRGHRKAMKLTDAAAALGIYMPEGDTHRALFDATMAARVWAGIQ